MADYTRFVSIVYTRSTYDEAVALADADAREQAVEAFGNANFETGGNSELKVKFNSDGTYTATSILYATPLPSPAPEVNPTEDPELLDQTTPVTEEVPVVDAPTDGTTYYENNGTESTSNVTNNAEPVSSTDDTEAARADLINQIDQAQDENLRQLLGGNGNTPDTVAARENAIQTQAQEQQTLAARLKTPTNGDWRVRISIAPNTDYLYNDTTNSLLAPLKATNGVLFPYTPIIETNYRASYDTADLTHSNYRGYFYKNSFVDAVSIRGTFTAQDTREASYLLAVIHFFRSVTKMFYGQDPAHRGSPPPLVFLNGMGQYQFNNHSCVVSNFSYSLPNDVDYVRVDPNNYGLNMLAQKTPAFTGAGNLLSSIKARLTSAGGIPLGGIFQPPVQSTVNQTVNTIDRATYVPTKMEISLTLLPIQSRRQVSQQFSFKDFANGNQLKGGFW